ncbi:S1 RNA-binding domain-containing protein [Aeromonas taiwanensis]
MTFGLRVAIEGRQGLLHHTQCPDWTNLVRTLPVGSQICVEILAMDDKGPKLRYAGPQLKFGIVAEELTVGSTYDAVVTGLKEYGIFLRIGARVGLLHRSQLSPNADIFNQYRIGQQHVVQVISIRSDGKVSFVLPGG